MTGPPPAVAATRLAVRRCLSGTESGATVLVACSGGADSLALLAATVFESRSLPVRTVGVVVDHGLQDDSALHTDRVVAQMAGLGVEETASIRVSVESRARGVEAGAREARYAALAHLADHFGSQMVLLGHTLDDQAETVLLGLTRGSGGRSVAGMRPGFEVFARPFLGLTRAQTEAACRAEQIPWWQDPHNSDPRFFRSRIRHAVLPVLERELGPGVAAALARTAESLREDVDFLDDEAEALVGRLERVPISDPAADDGTATAYEVDPLHVLPAALKHRAIRLLLLEAGALASELTRAHVLAVADLLAPGGPSKQVQLPGHLTADRDQGRLRLRRITRG